MVSQLLLGEGEWCELPASSGIFFDVRLKLITTYQYHHDFYFGEETFLKVQYQTPVPVVTIKVLIILSEIMCNTI